MVHARKIPVWGWLLLAVWAALAGCASGERYHALEIDAYSVANLHSEETDALNDQIFSAAQINADPSEYLLGAGDLMQVTVFESDKLNTTVRISSRGFVTLPLLGQMSVQGLTAREAEVEIEKAYKARYLQDPHVSIFVQEHFSQRVTLMGQFKNPGTFDMTTKMRLMDVMALGGGLTEQAGRTAQIRRIGSSADSPNTVLVDLDRMIRKGHSELNIEINGGDVVFVPEAGVYFVDGAVRKPGSYSISRSTNLFEALAQAGGLRPYADKNSVILVRHLGNGERKVLELDLKEQAVQETQIRDRDVLLVKASAMGKAMSGFRFTLGFPGVAGFGYQDPEVN